MWELDTNLNPVRSLIVLFNLKHIPFFSSPSCCCSGSVLFQGYCGCSELVFLTLVSSSSTLSWFCFIPLFLKEYLSWQRCLLNDLKILFWRLKPGSLGSHCWQKCATLIVPFYLNSCDCSQGPASAELIYFPPTWRPEEELNSCCSHWMTLTLPGLCLLLLCCFSHSVHLFSTLLLCPVQSLIFWPCLSFAVLEVRRHKIVLNNSQIAAVMWLFAHWMKTYKHSNAIATI